MTKRALFVFSFPFLLATLLTIVGCDLDGSDSGDAELAQIEQAVANAPTENQNSSSSTPATGSSTATTSSSGGGAGFLWKPVSEGDGNLVVLLPSSLRGKVSGAEIRKGGSTLEKGRFSGDTHNDNFYARRIAFRKRRRSTSQR